MQTLLRDDRFNDVPAELAKRIAAPLPDIIPQAKVEKGLVAIADKAMEGSSLDDKAKEASHNAVEAAIKQKAAPTP